MAQFNINFSAIPDNVVPEGEHIAVINKIELKEGAKAPYLNWEFDILTDGYEDRKIWMITSLADNAIFRLKEVAEALGYSGGFSFEIEEGTNLLVSPNLPGTEVKLIVEHREYQGQKRAGVKTVVDYFTSHHLGDADTAVADGDDFEAL